MRKFCELTFKELGLNYRDCVKIDERFYYSAEVDLLTGDATKAHNILSWKLLLNSLEKWFTPICNCLKITLRYLGKLGANNKLRKLSLRKVNNELKNNDDLLMHSIN